MVCIAVYVHVLQGGVCGLINLCSPPLFARPPPFTNRERDVAPFFLQWTESCSKLLNVSTPFFRVTGCYTTRILYLMVSQVKKPRGALNFFSQKNENRSLFRLNVKLAKIGTPRSICACGLQCAFRLHKGAAAAAEKAKAKGDRQAT